MGSVINAGVPKKVHQTEISELDVDIFMYIFFDGIINNTTQKNTSNKFRSKIAHRIKSVTNVEVSSGKSIFEYVNPKSIPGDDSLEDEIHIHHELHYDLPSYEKASYTNYKRIVTRVKKDVKKKVNEVCSLSNVSGVRLHVFSLFYNQGPIVSSIIGTVCSEDSENVQKKLSQLLGNPIFLGNKKIKYKQIEYVALADIIGLTDELSPCSAGFTTGSSDYSIISSKETKREQIDKHSPTEQDILDAAVLCQHTYDSQANIEKSVIDYVAGLSKKELEGIVHTITRPDIVSAGVDMTRIVAEAIAPSPTSFKLPGGIPISLEMMNLITSYLYNNKTEEKQLAGINEKYEEKEPVSIIFKRSIEGEKESLGKVSEETCRTNWRLVSSEEMSQTLFDGEDVWLKNYATGFYSQLYKKIGENKYAYCTCGTNFKSPVDWVFTNILQFFTGLSPQHSESVHVAKKLDKAIQKKGDGVLFFIGHSLGGGLASNNALVTKKRHAITFNAAGLFVGRVLGTLLVNNYKDLFHPRKRKEKIHAFVLEGEVLNWLSKPLWQGAYGTVKIIKPNDENEDLKKITGKGAKHAMTNFLYLKKELLLAIRK